MGKSSTPSSGSPRFKSRISHFPPLVLQIQTPPKTSKSHPFHSLPTKSPKLQPPSTLRSPLFLETPLISAVNSRVLFLPKTMHIKEICLEGFKSYATRTVVPGFDPFFNAITGLNGSGKSNILDSICFVLGITNLQQVRAANLQELVYKQGQAGVTKATVSILFDNSDRSRSPLGYEDCPEITVTRQVG